MCDVCCCNEAICLSSTSRASRSGSILCSFVFVLTRPAVLLDTGRDPCFPASPSPSTVPAAPQLAVSTLPSTPPPPIADVVHTPSGGCEDPPWEWVKGPSVCCTAHRCGIGHLKHALAPVTVTITMLLMTMTKARIAKDGARGVVPT